MRTHLLMGPPGCGKTRKAELAAAPERDPSGRNRAGTVVYHLCHAWTDTDELFVGVDVAAAVAGDAEAVRQEGVLTRAATLSRSGRVVLVLDELDKAPERAEALLLDFLQSGRVPVRPGVHLTADLENIETYITSNNSRPLSDPLLRRCRREWMSPLPASEVERIAVSRTGTAAGIVRALRKAAWAVAASEGRDHVTVAEITPMVVEAAGAKSIGDVRAALAAWAARTESGASFALHCKEAAPAWAEIQVERRARAR